MAHPKRENGSANLVEQGLGLLQIGGIEPLGEPAVDRGEEFAGLGRLVLGVRMRAEQGSKASPTPLSPSSCREIGETDGSAFGTPAALGPVEDAGA